MNKGRLRIAILALTDFLIFYSILVTTAYIYQKFGGRYDMIRYFKLWPVGVVLLACNSFIRLYHGNIFYPGVAISKVEEIRRLFFSVSLSTLVILSYLSISHQITHYSRFVIITAYALVVIILPASRTIARRIMQYIPVCRIDVLIAGAGKGGIFLLNKLKNNSLVGFNPVGFLDDNVINDEIADPTIPIMGKLSDANEVGKRVNVDYIILCLPLNVVKDKINELTGHFKHIMVIPDCEAGFSSCIYPAEIDGLAALEVKNQLLLIGPRACKFLLETLMALSAILVLWPLFLIIAIVVKLSSRGPIFYRATRLGLNGKTIKVLKFRTMYVDADDKLEKMLAEDPELEKEWREKFKLSNDPRITPIGKFMRKTSLDELPQFWNVLTGEMAVIGPRPIVEKEKAMYGDTYELISRVKPGITGLWQVSGRSETSYENRVFLDTYYIRNWSPWLDYYIFLKTITEVLFCKGAV